MLDIKITQGEYWGGAQINYWVYVFLAVFPLTGLFGFDHMALRSPMTAVMKFLSIIPLLGFWYFYDIAQILGERELVEKNGLAVPFYGPIGIGAGMFSGTEGVKVAPKDAPSPWLYLAYALTTCIFIAFPINKFVIGDYMGGIAQLTMYICIFTVITPFLAIAWGFYDIYKVLFKTRDIIEQGPERFIPATWFIDSKFKRDVLGPLPALPQEPDTWFKRLMAAWFELPISTLKAGAVAMGASSMIAKSATEAAVQPIQNATKVATNTVAAAGEASKAVTGTVEQGAKAMEGIAGLLAKIPEIGEKVASNLGDPQKLMEAAKTTHKGGALVQGPAVSSAVLVFGVGLVAFTGFVFYFMRKTYSKPEKTDDPLETQEQFEGLLKTENKAQAVVVYFTASWCTACTKLNHDEIQAAHPKIVWYKCDIDQNKYTLGYCGLQKIPSFVIIKNSKFFGKFTSSDTETVIEMLNDAFE